MKISPNKTLLLGGLSLTALSGIGQEQRPNIIFIMSDDHTTQAISCYDGSLNSTPNIDSLASDGVRFTNCFCTNAISAPSRASILTGLLSHRNGLYNNHAVFDTAQTNIAKILSASGYQTAIVGKWHLKSAPSGFDYWDILPGQGDYYNPEFIKMGEKSVNEGYVTDLITDKAIDWMDDADTSKPFFIMIHHKAPHRNWMPRIDQMENYRDTEIPVPDNYNDTYEGRQAAALQKMSVTEDLQLEYDLKIINPDSANTLAARYMGLSRMNPEDRQKWIESYRKRYEEYITLDSSKLDERKLNWYLQDYLACIDAVDESIGDVMNYLKENGLYENTIIIYTSDQGFYLGEHGWFDKRFMYEESLRMPFIIRDPYSKSDGEVRDQMVMNIDFTPTMLEYAKAEIPSDMQGESFVDVIGDKKAEGREAVYYHYFEFPGEHSVQRHYGIRTDRYKLIHFYHKIDQWELYDLEKDPKEMNSVYADPAYADILKNLQTLLQEERTRYGDTIISIPQNERKIINNANVKEQQLKFNPDSRYWGNGYNSLYDGIIENPTALNPGSLSTWNGFEGKDLDLNWTFDSVQQIQTITLRFLDLPGGWIFKPQAVEVYIITADSGEVKLTDHEIKSAFRPTGGTVFEYTFKVNTEAVGLKIDAKNIKVCPKGHPGEGRPAWLFIDEIIIR